VPDQPSLDWTGAPGFRGDASGARARADAIKKSVDEFVVRGLDTEDGTRVDGAVRQVMAIEMGMRLVREALAEAPSDAYLCQALAGCLSGLRMRLDNTADLLGAEAVRLRPDDPWLLVSLGATYADHGDLARAEAAWSAAVERLCGSREGRDQYLAAHALVFLGKALRQQGKEDAARATFRRAAKQIAFLRAHGCAAEGAEQALRAADPD
jgi:hypothetical protein